MLNNYPNNPLELFEDWLSEAEKSEINDPNAMSLATCGHDGQPSVRIVLLKGLDARGFKFHTNSESMKGEDIAENGKAALCFYWKSLHKQVRIEGSIHMIEDSETEEYFRARPREKQIGAWASAQSRPMADRDILQQEIAHFTKEFEGVKDIPKPPYWNGYRVVPQRMEFWLEGANRLHERFEYRLTNEEWVKSWLFP